MLDNLKILLQGSSGAGESALIIVGEKDDDTSEQKRDSNEQVLIQN